MARVLVIGAGVVGLAVADALATRGHDVVLCERHAAVGQETSSRNSEVLHAGLYYPPGSLKALLCVEGRERLVSFCRTEGVAHQWIGKAIVATDTEELPELAAIQTRAVACGAVPLQPMTRAELARRLPQVRAVAGLWSPGTGIVDSHGLMQRLLARLLRQDGVLLLGREVVEAELVPSGGFRVTLQGAAGREVDRFDAVVNAAGLLADRVARLMAPDPKAVTDVIPVKGSWFALAGPTPADALVYPVPAPHLLGLGVHLTVDRTGRARLGPDTQPATSLEDLRVDPSRAAAFLASAQRYLPGLRLQDLRPDTAGLRPKLAVDRFADFVVDERTSWGRPGWIDLLGIESPGLTASLAIGARVSAMV